MAKADITPKKTVEPYAPIDSKPFSSTSVTGKQRKLLEKLGVWAQVDQSMACMSPAEAIQNGTLLLPSTFRIVKGAPGKKPSATGGEKIVGLDDVKRLTFCSCKPLAKYLRERGANIDNDTASDEYAEVVRIVDLLQEAKQDLSVMVQAAKSKFPATLKIVGGAGPDYGTSGIWHNPNGELSKTNPAYPISSAGQTESYFGISVAPETNTLLVKDCGLMSRYVKDDPDTSIRNIIDEQSQAMVVLCRIFISCILAFAPTNIFEDADLVEEAQEKVRPVEGESDADYDGRVKAKIVAKFVQSASKQGGISWPIRSSDKETKGKRTSDGLVYGLSPDSSCLYDARFSFFKFASAPWRTTSDFQSDEVKPVIPQMSEEVQRLLNISLNSGEGMTYNALRILAKRQDASGTVKDFGMQSLRYNGAVVTYLIPAANVKEMVRFFFMFLYFWKVLTPFVTIGKTGAQVQRGWTHYSGKHNGGHVYYWWWCARGFGRQRHAHGHGRC